MKTVDCLFVMPPGDLWIRFEDGETRKANEIEERLVLTDMTAASEIHWQPQPPERTLPLAV